MGLVWVCDILLTSDVFRYEGLDYEFVHTRLDFDTT